MQSFLKKGHIYCWQENDRVTLKSNVKLSINGLIADVNFTLLKQFFFEVLLPFTAEQGRHNNYGVNDV